MAELNTITLGGYSITDGNGGVVELSTIEARLQENLMHNSLGLLFSAIPENASTIGANGTAIFRRVLLPDVQVYDGTNKAEKGGVGSVRVHRDNLQDISFELETLDLERIGPDVQAKIIAGMAKSQSAFIDAQIVEMAKNALTQATVTQAPEFETASTQAEFDTLSLTLTDAVATIEDLFSDAHLGVNEDSIITMMTKRAEIRTIKGLRGTGTEQMNIAEATAKLPYRRVGGFNIARSILLGKDLPATGPFRTAKTDNPLFGNNDNIIALSWVAQAFGLNIGAPNLDGIKIQNGNIKVLNKFSWGGKVIEPALIHSIVKDATVYPANQDALADQDIFKN